MSQFWKLYYKKIWIDNACEYLTETQNKIEGGPILVDIDMRFHKNTINRIYKLAEISDIVELYGDSLIEMFHFKEKYNIPVYIFEKDDVVQKNEFTKDGLHFVFGLHAKHSVQEILRDIVIEKEKNINQIFGEDGLGCINSPEDIFDNCISSGRNNWQVWGSRKPGYDAYKLKYIWELSIDGEDVENRTTIHW